MSGPRERAGLSESVSWTCIRTGSRAVEPDVHNPVPNGLPCLSPPPGPPVRPESGLQEDIYIQSGGVHRRAFVSLLNSPCAKPTQQTRFRPELVNLRIEIGRAHV